MYRRKGNVRISQVLYAPGKANKPGGYLVRPDKGINFHAILAHLVKIYLVITARGKFPDACCGRYFEVYKVADR